MASYAAPLRLSPAYHAAKQSYLAIFYVNRRLLSTSSKRLDSGHFNRPFTGSYEADAPTQGPLAEASRHGVPRLTPRKLKDWLDKYVVGQERPKMMMAVAIYNHYQRTQETYRQEEEEKERLAKLMRNRYDRVKRHPSEDEFPGQVPTVDMSEGKAVDLHDPKTYEPKRLATDLGLEDDSSPALIEKSNVMMIGPTGSGKTHMVKTLAKVLKVPFSVSDCTPFSQSGYVGEDAEICVHRLLAAADFDVSQAEHGIIYLDEVDKLAAARVSHGRDVSGEGVQQALLKIIEGTTISITTKTDKKGPSTFGGGFNGGAGAGAQGIGAGAKQETYHVRTDNILFIFSGAFVGLDKIILNRVSRYSIGFGASVRSKGSNSEEASKSKSNPHGLEPALFKNLPFNRSLSNIANGENKEPAEPPLLNVLDLVQPRDFQLYGLIPEFTGRIPITTALTPLSVPHLVRILTEPRSSLCAQYQSLFSTYGAELKFTTPALHAIAEEAHEQGTGARGLRTVMERCLGEAMYEVPGSSVKYVLVDKKGAKGERRLGFWGRGMVSHFKEAFDTDETEWANEREKANGEATADEAESESFVEYRKKAASGS